MNNLPNDILRYMYDYFHKIDLVVLLYVNKRCNKYASLLVADSEYISLTDSLYDGNTYFFATGGKYPEPLIINPSCYLTANAAYLGYIDVLKWARSDKQNRYDWNESVVCSFAIKYGDLEILSWITQNKCNLTSDVCSIAALYGHLEILKWARHNGCEWDSSRICSFAALNGHLEVIKWANQNGCELNLGICSTAAIYGHLEVIKWVMIDATTPLVDGVRDNQRYWDVMVCNNAAFNGHLEVIKWARENGCMWNSDVCYCAAANGHLEVIKWARQNGCDWDYQVCTYAAGHGHLDVLKWAIENGCDWNIEYCERSGQKHMHIQKWINDNKNVIVKSQ